MAAHIRPKSIGCRVLHAFVYWLQIRMRFKGNHFQTKLDFDFFFMFLISLCPHWNWKKCSLIWWLVMNFFLTFYCNIISKWSSHNGLQWIGQLNFHFFLYIEKLTHFCNFLKKFFFIKTYTTNFKSRDAKIEEQKRTFYSPPMTCLTNKGRFILV